MKQYLLGLPAHARVVAAALLALTACVVIYILLALGSWFLENQQRIYDLVPRIARLQGYTLSEETLRESAREVQAQLETMTYPAGEDTDTSGAAVQQQLRRYLETAGLSVSSSQLLDPRSHEGFEEIRLEVSASGPMSALDAALRDLRLARPALLVGSLRLSPMRNRRGDESQTILVSLSVSAVRLK